MLLVIETKKNLGMSGGKESATEVALYFGVECEQTHSVGNCSTPLAHALGCGLLSEVEVADQAGITESFINRVEVFTLEIFNQCKAGRRGVSGFNDASGNLLRSRCLKARRRRSPAMSS